MILKNIDNIVFDFNIINIKFNNINGLIVK
ncbi:hypothetical protein DFQ12_5104 [Sphingobacterium detergens]|uniref:Uncharacterized protein n=1 Tax=Sphingobacterium detergens TaxID=1145106 RepID=A0A420AFM2_SPHD1|nr:hypothetical protein DFQ12_5104 [Sphingobacterium detergens]